MVTTTSAFRRLVVSCSILFLTACGQGAPDAQGWIATGALTGTADVPANGAIQARALPDGTFLLSVQLNVPQADQGSSYAVELQSEDGERVRAGVLQAPAATVRHVGEFVLERDIRTFLQVSVVRQARSGASVVAATGALKPAPPRL